MATLIIIPNCDYATFEAIRDEILAKCPFALMNDIFASNRMEAHLFFHDVKYIPPQLMPYAIIPEMKEAYDFSKIKLPKEVRQV